MQKFFIYSFILFISIFFCVGCAKRMSHIETENILIEKKFNHLRNELREAWEKFLIDAKQIQNNQNFKK